MPSDAFIHTVDERVKQCLAEMIDLNLQSMRLEELRLGDQWANNKLLEIEDHKQRLLDQIKALDEEVRLLVYLASHD